MGVCLFGRERVDVHAHGEGGEEGQQKKYYDNDTGWEQAAACGVGRLLVSGWSVVGWSVVCSLVVGRSLVDWSLVVGRTPSDAGGVDNFVLEEGG